MTRKSNRRKNATKILCEVCGSYEEKPVVACDNCDKWHHFDCVGIKSIGTKETWLCEKCKPPSVRQSSRQSTSEAVPLQSKNLTSPSRNQNAEDDYVLTYDTSHPYCRANPIPALSISSHRHDDKTTNRPDDKAHSLSSISITSKISHRQRVELEIIEEGRILREKRDQDYLQQKYRVLMQKNTATERGSGASHISAPVTAPYAKDWVDKQRTDELDKARTNSPINDEFIKKLDALSFKTLPPVCETSHKPTTACQNQPPKRFDFLCCEMCDMVAPRRFFGSCLICTRECHFACMDIITIDGDTYYICSNCKRENRSQRVASEKSCQMDTSKAEEQTVHHYRCGICFLVNNQKLFEPCSECTQFCHCSCMTTTVINKKIVRTCYKCNRSDLKTTNEAEAKHRPSFSTVHEESTPVVYENSAKVQSLQPKSSAKDEDVTLTKSQIASRHVVTRDLPIFTGKPEQWPMFISRYRNSTKLCGYSNAENLDRLQKCLKFNALTAVGSQILSPEAVPNIIETLRMLYGRPELIVNSLLIKIRSEPAPKAEKLNSLVDFAMSVKNVCATLEQANLEDHLSNPSLMQELVAKLPYNIKIEWAKHKENIPDVNLSTLGNFLYDLARVISTITEPTFEKEPSKESSHKDSSNLNKPRSSSVVYAHQTQSNTREQSSDGKLEFKGRLEPYKPPGQCCICKKKCQKMAVCPVFLSFDTDQRWKEMYKNNLCRKCLDRHGRFCTQAKVCGVSGCIFKHHSLLHDEKKHSQESIENKRIETAAKNNNLHISTLRNVLLRIVPVTLHNGNQYIKTFAYQDDGSDVSMIEESLINELGIRGNVEPLCLLWTADVHRREDNSKVVKLEISGQNEFTTRYWVHDARTVESMGLPIQTISNEELVNKFQYLDGVRFIEYGNAVPRILIGSDNAHLNVPLEIIEGTFSQPIACQSRLGWSIHGRTNDLNQPLDNQVVNLHRLKCACQHKIDEDLHRLVKDHYNVENFGVQVNNKLNFCSKEDERALDLLKRYTKRIGNRYETALLWRFDDIKMPDSYGMAFKRLQCLEKHKPQTIAVIDRTIEDYIRKGYASKLTEVDIQNNKSSKIWYLPIFTVSHPKKPDKIRVVFDGAAKVNGVSLNSLLLTGPDQLSSLVDILRRFRERKVAAVGDITEMFPQVKIRREDIHAQRFLWRNGDTTKKPDEYVLEVMTFGGNCSPTSAQFVKNENASTFKDEYPRAVESIINNHYVDDMLDCRDSDEQMIQLINQVKKIHQHGGFEIRKFLSNSTAVQLACNENYDEIQGDDCLDISFGIERVLGMYWNTKNDCFTFSLKYAKIDQDIINGQRMPTKRELLKILMSIFDPLGLISHYLIHLKIILQDVWRSKLDWDDQITSNEIKIAWNNWLELLPNVEKIEIPRLYSTRMTPSIPRSIELHIFVDASEKGFSAVAYLRVEDDNGVDCVLVGSKARVSPLKYLSIPRLELQAGVLGARLLSSIEKAHTFRIDRRQIWTDSSTLLSWICSDNRKYHQFVAHRIGEILETTNPQDWRWIPSKQNVADEATKWSKSPSFDSGSRWFSVPEFLKRPESEWPGNDQFVPDTLEEMKVHFAHSKLILPILVNPVHTSNWNRMHRAVAYAKRYVSILRAKVKKESLPHGPLTRDELIASENLLFRQAQFQDFPEEMVILLRNQQLPKNQQKYVHRTSPLYKLSPYLDANGLIRHHGRIDSAIDACYSSKRPIILPRNNRITHLLVANFHRSFHHRNHRTVYNEIRQRFYIPCLRVVLNSIRNQCQQCKNRRAKVHPPQMADLPPARLAIGFRAFTYVGIDYFGPLFVTVGRRKEKRWGVLITCLTVRAVHVEIACKLDTESCIFCIRNFIHYRGCPEEIFSDQGTNLTGMDNELQQLVAQIDVERMATELTTCYTKWSFNPPHSPHMGGAWEKMVGLVKTCLYDILPTRNPTEDMLRNLLLEVCNIVYSRPLTYVPLEHDDDEVLTPNHFILGSSNGLKPMVDITSSGPILHSKWMENQRLTDLFWAKFIKEFLPDLTRRTKWYEPVEPIKIGDIVLLVDETNVRGQYPKCRVIETITGSNDQVRRARIQRINNEGSKVKTSILWRPVTCLAKLDVHQPEVSLPVEPGNSQTEGSVMNDGNTVRPDVAAQQRESKQV